MFGRAALQKAVLTAGLLGSLAGLTPAQAANAASMDQAWMSCGQGTETVSFGLPLSAPARWSQFIYTVDGGKTWQATAWYYSQYGAFYIWNGRALESIRDGGGPILLVGNQLRVYGYERTGSGDIYLGTCVTSSFFSGGIVYTYN